MKEKRKRIIIASIMVQHVTNIAVINTTYENKFTYIEFLNVSNKTCYTMCNCFI